MPIYMAVYSRNFFYPSIKNWLVYFFGSQHCFYLLTFLKNILLILCFGHILLLFMANPSSWGILICIYFWNAVQSAWRWRYFRLESQLLFLLNNVLHDVSNFLSWSFFCFLKISLKHILSFNQGRSFVYIFLAAAIIKRLSTGFSCRASFLNKLN